MIVVSYKGEKRFVAEEISVIVIRKMREVAEAFLGITVKNAILLFLPNLMTLNGRLQRMLARLLVLMLFVLSMSPLMLPWLMALTWKQTILVRTVC